MGWWLGIHLLHWESRDNYTDSYSIIALSSAIAGLIGAKQWGLFRSRFGAAIAYISLGLLLQFLGHLIYALYFRIGNVELAFPSVGDIPFLLTGVVYILGIYNLLKTIVVVGGIFQPKRVLLTSVAMSLSLSIFVWVSFLHFGAHDERGTIYSLLNIAYPLLQAIYFLMGVVALQQAGRMAGGKMFRAVQVLLIALVVQYAADFTFLYQDYHGTWQAAGSNDLLYVIAYGMMAFSLLMIENVRNNVLSNEKQQVGSDAEAGTDGGEA